MSASGNQEIEVKIAAQDLKAIEVRLAQLGFSTVTPRCFEANTLWDTPSLDWKASGEIVRLREFGSRRILTYKGPANSATKHKSREELETDLGAFAPIERVLTRAGLIPIFRYEKYRSEYQKDALPGTVTLDETPIGGYLELEGAPDWIDSTALSLGFSDEAYITKSYPTLYMEHCAENGIKGSHMTFSSPPGDAP